MHDLRQRPGVRSHLRTTAALVLAIAVTSCSTATGGAPKNLESTSADASPRVSTSAPAAVPKPTPPPFPEIAPVAGEAGWESEVSQHWAGYTFPTSNVTGVRAEWTEPTVQGSAGSEEFVWIGVGGWNEAVSNIIQDGTFVFFPRDGGVHEGIWYQRIPLEQKADFPLVAVYPGDHVYASVTRLSRTTNKWRLSVEDVSNGETFTVALKFRSLGSYPSFIVEDPNDGPVGPVGPFYPFPHWGSVTFSNIQVRVKSAWVSAATLSAIRIDMVRGGRILATAAPLSRRSSFSVIQR